jgi:hypothetical protein
MGPVSGIANADETRAGGQGRGRKSAGGSAACREAPFPEPPRYGATQASKAPKASAQRCRVAPPVALRPGPDHEECGGRPGATREQREPQRERRTWSKGQRDQQPPQERQRRSADTHERGRWRQPRRRRPVLLRARQGVAGQGEHQDGRGGPAKARNGRVVSRQYGRPASWRPASTRPRASTTRRRGRGLRRPGLEGRATLRDVAPRRSAP